MVACDFDSQTLSIDTVPSFLKAEFKAEDLTSQQISVSNVSDINEERLKLKTSLEGDNRYRSGNCLMRSV